MRTQMAKRVGQLMGTLTAIILAVCLCSSVVLAKDDRKAAGKAEYDKFKDRTMESIKNIDVGHHIYLDTYFSYDGQTQQERPETVTLMFDNSSSSWKFLTYHDVVFLLDDSVRVTPMRTDHSGDVGSGFVSELIFALFQTDDFLQIVRAQKIEGKLGNTEIRIKLKDRDKLRSFATRLKDAEIDSSTTKDGSR